MLPVLGGTSSTSYNLQRSVRLRSSASAYLSRTFTSTGNRQIWTWSGWVKRGALSSGALFGADGSNYMFMYFSPDSLDCGEVVGSQQWRRVTTQVFRDPSAWYHIVLAFDSTQATAGNRVKLYVNGSQVTAFSTSVDPSLNYNSVVNTTIAHSIGSFAAPTRQAYLDGYLTEVNFIDGQALTPSSFGSTNPITGVWQPAPYTGTYGTNGFELLFTDNSALTTSSNVGLGKDFSGNGNYWTTNNISITAGTTYDSMTDVPTLTSPTVANFAVLNPLKSYYAPTNGNLTMSTGANSTGIDVASISLGTGVKYYFEATATGTNQQIGIFSSNHALTPTGSKRYWYLESGGLYNDGTLLQSVATFTSGDTIAVAWDGTAQTVTFYKNNTQQGTAISVDTSYSYFFGVGAYNGGWNANFGQRPFAYTPPTGYVALNTYNLPTSTIVKGNTVMDATLWTGNGATQSIVNAAPFRPDLVWIKIRSAVGSHRLLDSVRGATNALSSNLTNAEFVDSTGLTAFNSNGFTLGADGSYNGSGSTYVGWQWQAGQGTTLTNTNGTITSTVSVNASAGFSVVTYTGTGANATVGHGLGVTPSLIICKARSTTGSWQTYHSSIGNTSAVFLNLDSAAFASSVYWNNTSPTSSVFSIGTSSFVNVASQTQVAYCFAPIAGYSAFGSYTGNGSADGPFLYTGFKPKFVLIKRTDVASSWIIWDSVRGPYNANNNDLYPDLNIAEYASPTDIIDMLSNGFKLRATGGGSNGSGNTFIYAAFAESPFKNSLAR